MGNLKTMSDIKLIEEYRNGNEMAIEELMTRYISLIYTLSAKYYMKGYDRSDLLQEARIGLYKAVRDYDASKNASFSYFLRKCIIFQLINAVKCANREKHRMMNNYVPIIDEMSEFDEKHKLHIPRNHTSAESIVIEKENYLELINYMKSELTPLEWKIASLYIQSVPIREIVDITQISYKAVDNALQRVKRKILRKYQLVC